MSCPKCQSRLVVVRRVLSSRNHGNVKRRVRKCRKCKHEWTTIEIEESELKLALKTVS